MDYASFVRCYEQDDPIRIRQKGINWIFWGILHLLSYRIIYYYWVPDPSEVNNFRELIVYLVTAYLFVLRLCGQAYLAVGILCLFGFDLPPIFNNYFLATNVVDFWRRTYIYWKDFITKIFYYRVFFLFRKLSLPLATAITTIILFEITWALHSYQFFWIKGVFPLHRTDIIFWNALGLIGCINAVVQLRRKDKKILGERSWSFVWALKRSIYGVLFFFSMTLLWSLWSSASLRSWLNVILSGRKASLSDLVILTAGVLLMILSATLLQYFYPGIRKLGRLRNNYFAVAVSIPLLLFIILGIQMKFNAQGQNSRFAAFVSSISEPRLNKRDTRTNVIGYYEPLMQRERFTAQFSEAPFLQAQDEGDDGVPIKRTNDLRIKSYSPSSQGLLKGKIFTTNQWGFRDREYALEKPLNTYRFAVLGGSMEMGSGVEDHEVFENLVENRLNDNQRNSMKYEILNFSVSGNALLINMEILKTSVIRFHPDSLLVFVHASEDLVVISNLERILNQRVDLKYDELKKIVNKAGITGGMERNDLARRILPYMDDLLDWLMETIASECRRNDIRAVAVLMPGPYSELQFNKRKDLALKHGFHVIDVTNAYPWNSHEYCTSPWDIHPNALGHKLIAQKLYEKIKQDQEFLGIHIR